MSRSRKKHPWIGYARSDSEKQDKRRANRKLRRINRELVRTALDIEDVHLVSLRNVSEIWKFAKDGKRLLKNIQSNDKYLRK